jgi:hypothetical protein
MKTSMKKLALNKATLAHISGGTTSIRTIGCSGGTGCGCSGSCNYTDCCYTVIEIYCTGGCTGK